VLELRRISKLFAGIPAVYDVSFSAMPGEVTGYLGPNGSGKSTTMKMIAGLLEPTVGEILFNGRPLRDDLIGYKRRMGYVPEEPFLYNYLSGVEYLTMVAQLRGLSPRQSEHPRSYALLVAILLIAALILWLFNRHQAKSAVLYYEESESEVITTIGIGSWQPINQEVSAQNH
jgi:ABC-type multidrug transport system ATPase subunit